MTENANLITLPDGRRLGFAQFGEAGGRPVFFMHGFPSTGLEAALLENAARSRGASIIAPDRPGFGHSDFQPGRQILDWPADVAALADALGIDRFRLIGGSAGCPYALACALRLDDRIPGLAVVAGLGPVADGGVVRRMGPAARLGFALANRAPFAFRLIFGVLARAVARYPDLNFRLNRAAAPDREVLADPNVRAVLRAAVGAAFRQGAPGPLHELALLAGPWGFAPGDIVCPLDIWHGERDCVVPHETGTLLAQRMPGARLRLVPEEGHVSLPVRRAGEIFDALLSRC
jgi:pimeloyl-ACP methyl ester carboxylesterase